MKHSQCLWHIVLISMVCILASRSYADHEQKQPAVVQKTVTDKKTRQSSRQHSTTLNMLYPFTLRVLYAPSYRFLTQQMRDNIEKSDKNGVETEVAQFFPIGAGLEMELAFNKWISLAVGGSFTWKDKIMTSELKVVGTSISIQPNIDYYEFVTGSSLYFNISDHFKLGIGAEVAFKNTSVDFFLMELTSSWKRVSTHLALRKDFFWSEVGFGVGLNTSFPFTDRLDFRLERKRYEDGRLKASEKINKADKDKDDGIYSIVLMPLLYVAF